MKNVIEVNNLTKKYDSFSLENINLDIPKGSIVGLVGENGAGKTTLIKSILNLINVDDGDIKILGKSNQEKDIYEDIGVVLDDSFLSDELTPNDLNRIMKNIYSNWDESKYREYINSFKLPVNKSYKEYSSGMKMKLKLAVTLSHYPKLLILDEPTSGLDPVVRNDILDIFEDYTSDKEHTIFVSSHITSDLEHIADSIIFIDEGKIILNTKVDKLKEDYAIINCTKEELSKIDNKDYLKYLKRKNEYKILINNKKEFKKKYKLNIEDKPSIEDIMLIMIKGEDNYE